MRNLNNLHILNLNEDALAVDESVHVEMERLRQEACMNLCYVPVYKTESAKFKVVFHNTRSLHKHFCDLNQIFRQQMLLLLQRQDCVLVIKEVSIILKILNYIDVMKNILKFDHIMVLLCI